MHLYLCLSLTEGRREEGKGGRKQKKRDEEKEAGKEEMKSVKNE